MRLTIPELDYTTPGVVDEMRLGTLSAAMAKLAAYEDTGLSPKELKESAEFVLELNKKLKPYMDAEEQGRLVILPVKAGDTVYQLRDKKHALGVGVHPRHISCVCVYGNDWIAEHQGDKPCAKKDLGKTWFLTREEAEAALIDRASAALLECDCDECSIPHTGTCRRAED